MNIKQFCVLIALGVFAVNAEAKTFPSNGKKLHYQFSKKEIHFEGQKKGNEFGVLRCYDLQKDSMWTVGYPWGSLRTEQKGLPLDSNYVFNMDISSKAIGPKLTLILEMKVEKKGKEAEGPIWLCSHKDALNTGYYPFGADEDHILVFKGKTSPKDTAAVLTQRFRTSGKADTYSTFFLLIDRTNGKHTFYQSDTTMYWYVDEAKRSVADYDRLVLRQCKSGGIREIALYNRLLTTKEIDEFYWGPSTMYNSTRGTHPPIKEPVPIVDNSDKFEDQVIMGVRGWTQKDVYAVVFCIILAIVSLVLNLFVRKKPIGYRGKGWVVLVFLIALVVAQLAFHGPLQGGHIYMIVGILCYIIVAFGPVPAGYASSPFMDFFYSLKGAFHISFNFFDWAIVRALKSGSGGSGGGGSTTTTVNHYSQSADGSMRYTGSHQVQSSSGGGGGGGWMAILVFAFYLGIALFVASTVSQLAVILVPVIILVRFVLNFWRNTF